MSDNIFSHLSSQSISDLTPYTPGKPVSELERELGIDHCIKLASNENPLGASPKALAAIHHLANEVSRYPDGSGFELRHKLAEKHQIDANCITLGNGSNDILDMIARIFLSPGYDSIFSQYAFAVYAISSQTVGANLKIIPAENFGHDLAGFSQAITDKTRVIWIANPNNPTGTWLSRSVITAFLQKVPKDVIVVLDEAYTEYVEQKDFPDGTHWLSEFKNLIVTRTFSKAYGLASLRVGYALSHPDIADLLNRVRQPFNVNSMALAGASAALEDAEFIRQSVALNKQGMAQLITGFNDLGLSHIPSVGNFIAVDVGFPAAKIDQALLTLGCITRPIANYGLPQHLRISIGLEIENERFLNCLKQVLSTC